MSTMPGNVHIARTVWAMSIVIQFFRHCPGNVEVFFNIGRARFICIRRKALSYLIKCLFPYQIKTCPFTSVNLKRAHFRVDFETCLCSCRFWNGPLFANRFKCAPFHGFFKMRHSSQGMSIYDNIYVTEYVTQRIYLTYTGWPILIAAAGLLGTQARQGNMFLTKVVESRGGNTIRLTFLTLSLTFKVILRSK